MKKILNLGCGKGQNVPQLLGKGDIYNLDIDQSSVDICEKRFPETICICSPAEDLNFTDGFFDQIYAFDILEHVTDLDSVVKKVYDMLSEEGILYVEVPYDKSEKMLMRIHPSYNEEIGHVRVFEYDNIGVTFSKYGFEVIKKNKSRGIVNLYLWACFKSGIHITDQMCTMTGPKRYLERFYFACSIWFDKNLFNTWLKWIPIWIVTMPIGWIITMIFPKTAIVIMRKI